MPPQFHVQHGPGAGYVVPELVVDDIGVPMDSDVVSLTVRRVGDANVLRWTDSTTRARTFYRVYRASPSRGFSDMVCENRGVDRCDLRAETLVTTRDALVRRSRSARRRGLPGRRRGELARRRHAR